MPGISRDIDIAGGDLIPTFQNTLVNKVYANGELVIVDGDGVAGHGSAPHLPQTISAGLANNVYVGGKLVVVAGDTADVCGEIATGSTNVIVG